MQPKDPSWLCASIYSAGFDAHCTAKSVCVCPSISTRKKPILLLCVWLARPMKVGDVLANPNSAQIMNDSMYDGVVVLFVG